MEIQKELKIVVVDGYERQAYFWDGVMLGYPLDDAMEILRLRLKKKEKGWSKRKNDKMD